jgi:hypothetical protein
MDGEAMTDQQQPDPLEGQEISLLNSMLAALHPLAKAGDPEAIDRVIKILQLKRQYREDRQNAQGKWRL